MNIQQLRYICEVARSGLNVSRAAATLHTSQPGVSSQIQALEQELGVAIFTRHHNRFVDITAEGTAIIERAKRALLEIDEIREIGNSHSKEESGTLVIAASHAQARFTLPKVIREFSLKYPMVRISVKNESGKQITETLRSRSADIGIMGDAGQMIDPHGELAIFQVQAYKRVLLVPRGHDLLKVKKLSLDDIARYPLILYEPSRTGEYVLRVLEQKNVTAKSVLRVTNADVVKAYVEHGLGVSVLPDIVYDPTRDKQIRAIDVSHLFVDGMTYLFLHKKHFLREYAYALIELVAPQLNRNVIQEGMAA